MISNLPPLFFDKLAQVVPADKKQQVLDSFCQKKPTTFRINTLKSRKEEVLKILKTLSVSISDVPRYSDAFILINESDREKITHSELVTKGMIYIQNLSSMIPAIVLDL